jgi:Asp/Glu/hydantoin racemase
MNKTPVAFIHTSPAAIAPLVQFYSEAAPELEITNLLDDGLLRLLAAKNFLVARQRLAEMLKASDESYHAELAMITCSSVSKETVDQLSCEFDFPILKIDYPMVHQAVRTGTTIGVAATFEPTMEPTSKLLLQAASDAGVEIKMIHAIVPEAYTALLAGDTKTHDDLLFDAIKRLEAENVSVIVLAQVSMARILPQLDGEVSVPTLSSLHTSLDAIRAALNHSRI